MRERAPGVWELRVELAPHPGTGRRRSLSRSHRGSERSASAALAHLVVEAGGRELAEVQGTVTSLFDAWLDAPGKGGRPRAATSAYQERRRFERHVQPVFGSWAPARVRREDLNRLYADLLAGGRSPASVHRVQELISAMYARGTRIKQDERIRRMLAVQKARDKPWREVCQPWTRTVALRGDCEFFVSLYSDRHEHIDSRANGATT